MKIWNVRTTSTTEYCPFCGAPIKCIHVTVDGLYVYHDDNTMPCEVQAEYVVDLDKEGTDVL